MTDFSSDIENFRKNGTYDYKFDSVGNLTFISSSSTFSQVYLAFEIKNISYNNPKIASFYDPEFVEFTPTNLITSSVDVSDLQQQTNVLMSENETLKTQLDLLTSQVDSSATQSDQLAVKQVILELRKSLGQGRVDSDFSTDFPYAPIRKDT